MAGERCTVCGRPFDEADLLPREILCRGCEGERLQAIAEMEEEFDDYEAAEEAYAVEWEAWDKLSARKRKKVAEPQPPDVPPMKREDIPKLARHVGWNNHAAREKVRSKALIKRNLLRNADGFDARDGATPLKAFTDRNGVKITVAKMKQRARQTLDAMMAAGEI